MGEYQNIKVSIEDRAAILTIDHPPANALDRQTVLELAAAFDKVLEDDQAKVIIITGAGQFFGAGADINEIVELESYDQAYEIVRLGHLDELPKVEEYVELSWSRRPLILLGQERAT